MMYEWKPGERFYISGYLSENFDRIIKGVMKKNTSAVVLVDGRSGLGKTTLSFQLSAYIASEVAKYKTKKYKKEYKPKFSLDDVAWTPDVFIDKLKNATAGDIVILDEGMILSNRTAMSEVNRMVVIMMSLIRSKQIFVMINVNSIFDMDRNLPLHRADVLLHLYAIDDKFASRGRYFVVPTSKGKLKRLYILGKKYYDYSVAQPAFRDHFSAYFPVDDKVYESRKQKAIASYFEEKQSPRALKVMDQRNRLIRFLRDLEQPVKEICKKAGISDQAVYDALKKW